MGKLKEKAIATTLLLTSLVVTNATVSNAIAESRPDYESLISKTASQFFAIVRQMETEGGPLGLKATVDDTGTETSASNGIDCHMIKNTEYGTVGMLAASIYGAKTSTGFGSVKTTTNNVTGVYQMGTKSNEKNEYVAGILGTATSVYVTNIKNADPKYWNNYTDSKDSYKPGDGTKAEISWARDNSWVSSSYPVFARQYQQGVFDCYGEDGEADRGDVYEYRHYSSRAVVVCGAGL